MSWVKLDDQFFSHPKVVAAGRDGRAMYLAALCWTKAHLTDGIIPKAMLPQLSIVALDRAAGGDKAANGLVNAGLWHDEGDYWRINDYHQRNESADDEKARRDRIAAERSRAGRTGGLNSGASRRATKQRSKREAKVKQPREANVKPDTDTYTKDIEIPPPPLVGRARRGRGGGGEVISISTALGGTA